MYMDILMFTKVQQKKKPKKDAIRDFIYTFFTF